MWLMQLGEVVFGGVGSGLYGMIMFAIVAVFIAGLMIGRTPEYLGKKLGAFEIKMASIAILLPPLLVLCGAAIAVMADAGKAGVANPAEHGFSEILYAFSSASNNNGSAFAGLSANTPFYNTALGICMLFARYWLAIPVLALAGAFGGREARARIGGNAAHAYAAVRVRTHQRRRHRGRIDVRSGARARPGGRAPAHLRRQLTGRHSSRNRHDNSSRQTDRAVVVRRSRRDEGSARRQLPTADAPLPVAQSGDVRRLYRQHSDDDPLATGADRNRARRPPASSWPSRCGCG